MSQFERQILMNVDPRSVEPSSKKTRKLSRHQRIGPDLGVSLPTSERLREEDYRVAPDLLTTQTLWFDEASVPDVFFSHKINITIQLTGSRDYLRRCRGRISAMLWGQSRDHRMSLTPPLLCGVFSRRGTCAFPWPAERPYGPTLRWSSCFTPFEQH